MELDEAAKKAQGIINEVKKVYKGGDRLIETAVAAILSEGHLLIEGLPGTGKTLLAKALAKAIGGKFSRIQGNPDILPSDILGFHVYRLDGTQRFIKGPIFSNIVFFDELNRAPLRSQAALLEAMQEKQVTVDGITYPLDRPFTVIATQVPLELGIGINPLSETLIDRFTVSVRSSYVNPRHEFEVIKVSDEAETLENIEPVLTPKELLDLINTAKNKVYVDDRIIKYIVDLVTYIRRHEAVESGPSHRGSVYLYRIARSYALMQGRSYVIPDDVKRFAVETLVHRIVLRREREAEGLTPAALVKQALEVVKVPKE